jgi:hypothetical protein
MGCEGEPRRDEIHADGDEGGNDRHEPPVERPAGRRAEFKGISDHGEGGGNLDHTNDVATVGEEIHQPRGNENETPVGHGEPVPHADVLDRLDHLMRRRDPASTDANVGDNQPHHSEIENDARTLKAVGLRRRSWLVSGGAHESELGLLFVNAFLRGHRTR